MLNHVPRRFLRPLLLLQATFALAASEQVELHMTDGKIVAGELVAETDGRVTVKSSMPTKNGAAMSITRDYDRADIKEVVRLADPETTYATRAVAAKTGADHAALAAWCRDQSMADRAAEHAQRALALDPSQDAAAKLLADLGWVKDGQTWVKEADWLAKQGKVRYQGQIMTIEEADKLKAAAKQAQARKDAQQAVDDKIATLAALDKEIANLPKRPAEIDTEIAKDNAALAAAQASAQKVPIAKSTLDGAEKALQDAQRAQASAQGSGRGPGGGAGSNSQNLSALQQAVETAQKTYNAAKRDAGGADREVARLQGAIAALKDEKTNLDKKAVSLKARRETLAKELDDAKAALAAMPVDAPEAKPATDAAGGKPAP